MPASLDALTGSQTALVEFLRVDRDLVEVAAAASPPRAEVRVDVARWVSGLSGAERDALLVGLLEGKDPLLRAATLRRAGPGRRDGAGVRTAGELRDQAAARREQRKQAERDRRAVRAAENARRALGQWATIEELDGGSSCRLRMTVENLDWPALALGSIGADFEIVQPPELLEKVHEWGGRFSRAKGRD